MAHHTLQNIAVSSTLATAATTVAAFVLGKKETPSAAAPLNATSHILWGEEAEHEDRFDVKHTFAGAALNAGAMVAWAGVHAKLFPGKHGLLGALASGSAVSLLAYITDYHFVPKRLTPGFEARLSAKGLWTIYGVLAGSLALGAMLRPAKD